MTADKINPEQFGRLFHDGEYERIYGETTNEFQRIVSLQDFIAMAQSFNVGVDKYELENETSLERTDRYLWIDDRKEKAIVVSFNKEKKISELYIKPYATYPKTDRRYTKVAYNVPVTGNWLVFWGGANEFLNYHYPYENQRYAYDLVKTRAGSSYKDNPNENENYYAFNEEIISPADGKVVTVVDRIQDNVPGERDEANPAGSYVVIQHAPEEYSMLAHLKKDSVKVQIGDAVKEGEPIGKCGNSGNSSEPHVHFQVMDHPDLEQAKSIRIKFKDKSEPIQGDTVSKMQPSKRISKEKMQKIDDTLTFGELLFYIPRAIFQFFKNL